MKITVNKTQSFFKGMCVMSAFWDPLSSRECGTGDSSSIAIQTEAWLDLVWTSVII